VIEVIKNDGDPKPVCHEGGKNIRREDDIDFFLPGDPFESEKVKWCIQYIVEGRVVNFQRTALNELAPGRPGSIIFEFPEMEMEDEYFVAFSEDIEDEVEAVGNGMPRPIRGWDDENVHFLTRYSRKGG